MNVNNKFNNPQDIALESYLNAYGIDDVDEFVNPKGKYLDSPWNYEGIERGINFLRDIAENSDNMTVGLICDSDVDGNCSSTLAYLFLKHIGVPKENINVFFHMGKQHGLTDVIMGEILNSGCNAMWICDASSNDIDQCEFLQDMGINTLITDHHELEKENPYAIVINNQSSPNISNKDLCGTGVTFQLIRAYCEKYNDDWYQDKLDLVAMANVADVMSMANYENRWINSWGLSYINNPLFKAMIKQYMREDNVTPKDVSWSIAPRLNSLCRSDNQELKERVFYALCGEETDYHEITQELRKCHDKQTREVREIYEKLLEKTPTTINNIIIQTLDKSTPYTGLVANKLMSYYNRPIVLVHSNGRGFLSGSCRSPVPFKQYLNDCAAITFARGHEQAFGLGYSEDKFPNLVEYLNTTPLDITPTKDVACSVGSVVEIPKALFLLGNNYKELWGEDIPAPLVYIHDVRINGKDIKEMVGNAIKFRLGMVDVLKFKCSNKFKEELGVGKDKWINLDLIVSPELNEWNGNVYRQCIIEECEVL